MPPEDRFVCRFAAEPPQDPLPYGRWSDRLRVEFLAACLRMDDEGEDVGQPGDLTFYPDRTWNGRTYVPVTTYTSTGYELYGYVTFPAGTGGGEEEPAELEATAEFTSETAQANPDWQLDLCDAVIGTWRGEQGKGAAMTLVWGRPMVIGGSVATAELAGLVVDQCRLVDDRFTLVAPDDYRGDILDIKLFSAGDRELAAESLYAEDDDGDAEDAA
jgi:hypothetical protein